MTENLSEHSLLYIASISMVICTIRPWDRATSHTRLKAHDHGNVRALIGRKGGDRPSSLHTRR